MTAKNDLSQAIDRLVTENTFNLEALEGIRTLKDRAKALENENAEHQHTIKVQKETIHNLRGEYSVLKAEAEQHKLKIDELYKHYEDGKKALWDADMHKAVAEAYRDAMNIVFRPHAVRETVSRSIPLTVTNGSNGVTSSYVQSHQETSNFVKEDV